MKIRNFMKGSWLLLFLVCINFWAVAQHNDAFLDSLKNALKTSKKTDEKFKTLMEISDYWSYRDTAKAFSVLREAEQYIKTDYQSGLHLFYKAGIYFDKNIAKSQELYLEAEPLIATQNTPKAYEYRAKLWHNYGALEQIKGDTKRFMHITLEKCIPFAEKSGNKILLASNYTDVGMMFANVKEYDKAIDYYLKATQLLEENKNITTKKNEMTTWAYINLAEAYLILKQNDKAYKEILKAENILKNIPQSQYHVPLYKIKSQYYTKINNFPESLSNIEKGITFAQSLGLEYDEQVLTYEKYKIYKEQKQYDKAKSVISNLLNQNKFKKNMRNRLIYLNELATLEEQTGNYQEAYQHLKSFQALNDSLVAEEEKMKMISLESEFKNKEQQSEILHLTSKNQQQKIIFWISLGLVFSIASFTIYTIYQRKQHNEQKLLLLEQTKERELEQALSEGENKERERISKELHDGIGGKITGIKIGLEQLAREHNDEKLLKNVARLDETLSEIRTISRNLTPVALQKYGLEEAIKDYCQNSENEHCSITTYLKNLNTVQNKTMQMHIFRILQEVVSNAIKHSESSKILVQCTHETPFLLMEIEDNGKGFNPNTTQRNLGLDNIEKRVKALNGNISIESILHKGTTITIECHL